VAVGYHPPSAQAKIALWESENMERLRSGAQLGGEMTAYYTLSEAGLDEGILLLSLHTLVCIDNPY
jgi:hypothetical protein